MFRIFSRLHKKQYSIPTFFFLTLLLLCKMFVFTLDFTSHIFVLIFPSKSSSTPAYLNMHLISQTTIILFLKFSSNLSSTLTPPVSGAAFASILSFDPCSYSSSNSSGSGRQVLDSGRDGKAEIRRLKIKIQHQSSRRCRLPARVGQGHLFLGSAPIGDTKLSTR